MSRTTYAGLFAAIGIQFGTGDGVNTFNLPDLRGRFLRGWDNGAGNDPDAASRFATDAGGISGDHVGSLEGSEFTSHDHGGSTGNVDLTHTHSLPEQLGSAQGGSGFVGSMYSSNSGASNGSQASSGPNVSLNHSHTIPSQGGSETRPFNVSVNYIIKQ